jgi:hypothetical protein
MLLITVFGAFVVALLLLFTFSLCQVAGQADRRSGEK